MNEENNDNQIDSTIIAAAFKEHDRAIRKAENAFEKSISPFVKACDQILAELNAQLIKSEANTKPAYDAETSAAKAELEEAKKKAERQCQIEVENYELEFKAQLEFQAQEESWEKYPEASKQVAKYKHMTPIWEYASKRLPKLIPYEARPYYYRLVSASTAAALIDCEWRYLQIPYQQAIEEAKADKLRQLQRQMHSKINEANGRKAEAIDVATTVYHRRTYVAEQKYRSEIEPIKKAIGIEEAKFRNQIREYEDLFKASLKAAQIKLFSTLKL